MGTRSVLGCFALALVATACGDQQQPESMAGPSLAGQPTNPAACNPKSLNSLISGYFPGGSANVIKGYKDAMVAAPNTKPARDNGFAILDSIGLLSRRITVDGVAGSNLAKGVIACMFDATSFTPSFPSNAIYNFAPALAASAGGGFYTRGANTGSADPVLGALTEEDPVEVLSGVTTLTGSTWTTTLSSNASSEGRALIYGYRVGTTDPLVYEWASIPPAVTFAPGALVAICDGADADTSMVSESNVGVLAYTSASPICNAPLVPVVLKETGWGPRALAARLARAVVTVVQPQVVQAAVAKSGTGGTPTTFRSKFKKNAVTNVSLKYTLTPKSRPRVGETVTAEVRATTLIDGVTTGVNGVCVYLKGSNNNGQGTSLVGATDSRCKPIAEWVGEYTESKDGVAGYAAYSFSVTKTGGLILTATASDDNGTAIGVVDRNGQTFVGATFKMNVNP